MIKGDSSKVLYFNSSIRRKKQIYNWILEVSENSNIKFNNIFALLSQGETERAFKEFELDIFGIMSIEATLGYILQENINKFGKKNILIDLYQNIILNKFKIKPQLPKTIPQKPTSKEVKEFTTKKEMETKKFRFGLDKNNKKRKAQIKAVVINNKVQYKLVDLENKQFLTQTKNVKKEIKRLKKL